MIRWTSTPFDRVFDEFFSPSTQTRAGFLPIDIHRHGDDMVVEASVPGYTPDEVDVSIDNDMLTISAKHEHEQEHGGPHGQGASGQGQEQGECVRHERYFGSLYRQVYLGQGVQADQAQADFDNGVLRVTIPLQQKQQAHRVQVKSGGSQAGS